MSENSKIRDNMADAIGKLNDLYNIQAKVGIQNMDGHIVDVGRINTLIDRLDAIDGRCDWLYNEANTVFQDLKRFLEVVEDIEDYDRSMNQSELQDTARKILSLASGASATFCHITEELFTNVNDLLDNKLADLMSADSNTCLTHVVSMVSSISGRVK